MIELVDQGGPMARAIRENRIGRWLVYAGQLYEFPDATAALLSETLILSAHYDVVTRAHIYIGFHPAFECCHPQVGGVPAYPVIYKAEGPAEFCRLDPEHPIRRRDPLPGSGSVA